MDRSRTKIPAALTKESLSASLISLVVFPATSTHAEPAKTPAPIYHLHAVAPIQPLTDSVFRYLSERGANAYAEKNYQKAEMYYRAALSDAQNRGAKPTDKVLLTANLASACREDGHVDQARLLFEQALKGAEQNDCTPPVYSYVLRQYSVFLSKTGQTDKARFAAEAARLGHKLQAGASLRSSLLDKGSIPTISVHPLPPYSLPARNPNDPYWDVSFPLPAVGNAGKEPWSFQLHFAECPPRERWAVFDEEQKSRLNHQWHEWLRKFRAAMETAIAGSPALPESGRYHLIIHRSGHIDDVEALSNERASDQQLQSVGSSISRMNTASPIDFPAESQIDEIHLVMQFNRPQQENNQETELLKAEPRTLNGWTAVYPIHGYPLYPSYHPSPFTPRPSVNSPGRGFTPSMSGLGSASPAMSPVSPWIPSVLTPMKSTVSRSSYR